MSRSRIRDIMLVLGRGLRRRCPQCGEGRLFTTWYTLAPECPCCRLPLASREGDTWAFMYVSMAFITGLIIILMLLIRPAIIWLGQITIVIIAIIFIIGSLPLRKGLAIAVDYFIALNSENNGGLELRRDK